MKHDLVILNNYVRPNPVFKKKYKVKDESYKNLYMKMLGLSNMINLMNMAHMSKALGGLQMQP